MTILEIALICILLVTFGLLTVVSYFAIKFGILILDIEDAIEQSLDILDSRYESISEIVEIPLFSDSPQIRQVHQDLKYSRDALISVANVLVGEFKHLENIKDIDDGETTQKDT